MDGQHTYEIVIHKGDLLIELSSDDLYFISKQMDKWFRILLDDSYVPTPYFPPSPPTPEPSSEPQQAPPSPPPPTPQAAPAHPNDLSNVNLPTQQPVPQPAPQPQPVQYQQPAPPPVENPPQPVENLQPQPVQPPPQPAPPPVQNPVQNSVDQFVQPPPPVPQPQPVENPQPHAVQPQEAPIREAVQPALPLQQQPAPPPPSQPVENDLDDFEKVMDSLMEDLEGDTGEALTDEAGDDDFFGPAGEDNGHGGAHRDAVINSLTDLCNRGNVNTHEDYLMLSAYYLTYFEALDKFSLKRVNSLMVQSGLAPVNHSVLETAMSKGLLSMVPDMTGTAEMSEYALTNEGQSHVERLI